jgi:hypothetical protein
MASDLTRMHEQEVESAGLKRMYAELPLEHASIEVVLTR